MEQTNENINRVRKIIQTMGHPNIYAHRMFKLFLDTLSKRENLIL